MASYQDRIACWNDTKKMTENKPVVESIKYEYDEHFTYEPKYATITDIVDMDTLDCGIEMQQHRGFNPLLLNHADDVFPGGCVDLGSGAQEESIFRRTNYHKTLQQSFYQLHDNQCVYSPDVIVCKSAENYGWRRHDDIHVALIACPGIKQPRINYKTQEYPVFKEEQTAIFKNKIRLIFQVAYKNGHDSLVLGALSCGAWRGPVKHISMLFNEVIKEYAGMFKLIRFAILRNCGEYVLKNNSAVDNFEHFAETFIAK